MKKTGGFIKIHALGMAGALLMLSHCTPPRHNKPAEWKKLRCGLYLGPKGQLGFATEPELADRPNARLQPEQCANAFITHLGTDGKIPLKTVIDTLTFEALGAGFYKDKSGIYSHYAICEGGYLSVFATDTSGFCPLGTEYALYRHRIYHNRQGLTDADALTFKTDRKAGAYGKDRYGFFAYGERISEEALQTEAGREVWEHVKSL